MKKSTSKVSVVICLALLCPAVLGQSGPLALQQTTDQTWMTQAWTGDSSPYRKMRDQIDQELASGKPLETLVQESEATAQARPIDPKAQFDWAYLVHKQFVTYQVKGDDIQALQSLIRADPKNVYEYTRLRFLLTEEEDAMVNLPRLYLQRIGIRLERHDSRDVQVRTHLIYALCSDPRNLLEALREAKSWEKAVPNNAIAHATTAFVHQEIFDYSKGTDKESMTAAVAEYQQYLRLAPPNGSFRKHAALMVRLLPTEAPW